MGRARGSRNADHDEKRRTMCRAMVPALRSEGRPATLAELAEAAGVSVSTLRHYFGDREAVVQAVLRQAHHDAAPYLVPVDTGSDAHASLTAFLGSLVEGWRSAPLGRLFLGSITSGIGHPVLGPAAVEHVLEPTSQALELRIESLQAQGALSSELDPRRGALALLGPVVLALIHQDDLSGAQCRALDIDGFVNDLVTDFVRAHRGSR